jgi:ankyrin repeat protein
MKKLERLTNKYYKSYYEQKHALIEIKSELKKLVGSDKIIVEEDYHQEEESINILVGITPNRVDKTIFDLINSLNISGYIDMDDF